MLLVNLLSSLSFYKSNKEVKDINIRQLQINHQLVQKNDMFICIKGFTVDGHDYAEQAIKNGAYVIVTEKQLNLPSCLEIVVANTERALAMLSAKFYQYPTSKMKLVGITGTNGKTTTSYLLHEIFTENEINNGIIGTIHIKFNGQIISTENTTPNALAIQNYCSQMVESNVKNIFMEVSSHSLDLGRVYGCDFDIALMTNISQDHLDYHKNLEDYVRVKTLLFSGLGTNYKNKKKYAVLNCDDDYYKLFDKSTGQEVITYGFKHMSMVRAINIRYSLKGTSFTMKTPNGDVFIKSQLVGQFNVYNMLAATAVSILSDIPLETIKIALEKIRGIDGRMEQVDVGQAYSVIVDYAHTPDSLENVLKTIKEFSSGNVIVVIGAGGDRDCSKRPLMAKIAVNYSDIAIFTSDNPRTENPIDILDDMTRELKADNYVCIESRHEAIMKSINLADDNDTVVIAGKGHETYQEINGVKHHFDDREIAKKAIKERGK